MKNLLFHVRIVFLPYNSDKTKKVEDYLFTIYIFVYLCAKFKSVT
jgi:hypothetical protein